MHRCSNASCVVTSGISPASPCLQHPAHRTLSTPGALIGFAAKTAAVSSRSAPHPTCPNRDATRMRALPQPNNKKPTGDRSPVGRAVNPSSQHILLVTATTAKVEMKSRQTDMPAAAAVAGAMTGVVTAAMTRCVVASRAMTGIVTTAMTRRVVAGAVAWRVVPATVAGAMTVVVVGTMAAAMTRTVGMMISRLHRSSREDGEAGSDGQEGDELFHDDLSLSRCRQRAACQSDAAQMRLFSSTTLFSHF